MMPSVLVAVELLVAYFCFVVFTRYWRLRKIPGPLIASLTDIWRAKKQRSGPTGPWLQALHQRYGPLVRIGPNTISINDAGSMRTIFTSKGDFPKVIIPVSYAKRPTAGGAHTLVG